MYSWLFWKYKCTEENYNIKKGRMARLWSSNLMALCSWVILVTIVFGEVWFSKQSIWKFLNKLTSSLCLACHEHSLYNFDTGSFVCLPVNGKNYSYKLLFLYKEQILKLYNSWIYKHIPTHKPIQWSLPPFS